MYALYRNQHADKEFNLMIDIDNLQNETIEKTNISIALKFFTQQDSKN